MHTNHQHTDRQRDRANVLADAIRVLTEAARLRRPVKFQDENGEMRDHLVETDPQDWAAFVTEALISAAANVGSIDAVLAGRPGSWEAAGVRHLLEATVGDEAHLHAHRTEPIRIVVRPEQILDELDITWLYDDSLVALDYEQDAAMCKLNNDTPDAELDTPAYLQQEQAILNTFEVQLTALGAQREREWKAYADAFAHNLRQEAARRYPGATLEVHIDLSTDPTRHDETDWWLDDTPEVHLIRFAAAHTPLPGSGIAPKDYPSGTSIHDAEHDASRLPHLRLTK